MSATVEVSKLAGNTCITVDQGEPIFVAVHKLLTGGESVVLDFSGVSVCASPFLNSAVGRLLKDFSPEDLERKLTVQELTPVSMALLRRVIENSRRYYRDPAAKKALDDILNEEPADDGDGR